MSARLYHVCDFCWLAICIIFSAVTPNFLLSFAISFVCLFLPLFLIFGGVKRIKSHIQRKKMLKGRTHRKLGTFSDIQPYDTGKEETVSVLTGYSQKQFAGTIYNHYKYEKRKVFDGLVGTFEVCKKDDKFYYTGDKLAIRTLPRSFSYREEQLPPENGVVEITYVTGPDGMNYFLDARPAH